MATWATAACQPLHPDASFGCKFCAETALKKGAALEDCFKEPTRVVSLFIALQDITMEQGPTIVCPGTHTCESHNLWRSHVCTASTPTAAEELLQKCCRCDDASACSAAALSGNSECIPLVLPAGAAALMDGVFLLRQTGDHGQQPRGWWRTSYNSAFMDCGLQGERSTVAAVTTRIRQHLLRLGVPSTRVHSFMWCCT